MSNVKFDTENLHLYNLLGYIGIAYLPCTPSFSSMICTTINRELSSHV